MRVCLQQLKITLLVLVLALPVAAQNNEQTWTVNFKDSDIQEVIKFIAEATGKTIIIDPKVRGQVKVISEKAVNRGELYALFLSILDVHGFTAVESGGVVRIVPNRDARSLAIPSSDETTRSADPDNYITQVIQLQNISAAKLLPILRVMVPQHGHISAYDPSNAIIITDTRSNINRLEDVIAQIDKAAVVSTDIVELRYASADAIVKVLQQLEKPEAQRGNASAPVSLVADTRTNAVLINGDDLQRQRIKALINRLDRPQLANSNVRVVYLKYAKAEQVAKVLNGVLQNIESSQTAEQRTGNAVKANVQADEDTNAILITAEPDVVQSMMGLVESLDIRRAQVLVEAIIVEIDDSAERELGVEWMYRDDEIGFGSSTNGGSGYMGTGNSQSGSLVGNALDGSDSALAGLAGNLAGIPGQLFGFGRLGERTDFFGLLRLLKENSASNILSTPSILTTDNHTASISVGQNVPYQTGSFAGTGSGGSNPGNPFNTFERKDVGILLEVTPHVNDGDTVVMDISQEISSVLPGSGENLTTNQRKINTQAMAASGEIIVLGGLIKDDVKSGERRVPILGDIPVLGNLFKSQTNSKIKTNLMIFIRATVIPDDSMLEGATAEKYHYIRQQMQNQQDTANLLTRDLPMLPEWEEQLRRVQSQYQQETQPAESESD